MAMSVAATRALGVASTSFVAQPQQFSSQRNVRSSFAGTPFLRVQSRARFTMNKASQGMEAGASGNDTPMSVYTQSAPLETKGEPDVGKRIAYLCQDCGYVYKDEKPFEDVPESYNCPVCAAPKSRFRMQNATVEETEDISDSQDTGVGGRQDK